jgi:hypothetical protein
MYITVHHSSLQSSAWFPIAEEGKSYFKLSIYDLYMGESLWGTCCGEVRKLEQEGSGTKYPKLNTESKGKKG